MALNNIINFPNNSPIDTANPKLVHGLLAAILKEQDPDLIVESIKHQFMQAATPTICTSKAVSISIEQEDIIGSPDHIDFYVTGTVENQQGETTTCTLYLNLRTTSAEHAVFANGFVKHPEEIPLVMEFANDTEHLTDTIFELDLLKTDVDGEKQIIGHGKGYLLFKKRVVAAGALRDVA